MNANMTNERLDELAREIAQLDAELINHQRDALDVVGDEAVCFARQVRADATRVRLERALRAYFIVSEFARRGARRAA